MRGKNAVRHRKQKHMIDVDPSFLVITLKVNGLNASIKREIGRMD